MNNPQMDMPKSHPSPSRSPSTDRQRRNALIVSITMTVMAIPSVGLFIYYGLANDVWQFNVFSGLIAVSGILNIAAVILTLRGKSNTGMLLCISGAMFVILIAPFMLQGAGFILLLAAVIISTAITALAMPARFSLWGILIGLTVGTMAILLDINIGGDRVKSPEIDVFSPYIVATLVVVFALTTLREFRRYSLRTKIVLGIIFTGGISVGVLAIFAINRAGQIVNVITDKYERGISSQTETQLANLVDDEANKADLLFGDAQDVVEDITAYRSELESQSTLLGQGAYWDAHTKLFQLPQGQYGNTLNDPASIFVPSTVPVDEAVLQDLNTSAYLDFSAGNFLDKYPHIAALYYISGKGTTTYYPNVNLAAIIPADFDALDESFYTIASPQKNPDRGIRWTDVYQDPAGQGLVVTASGPVYDKGGIFKGVIGADLQLAAIAENLSTVKVGDTGFAFLLDGTGHILFMPPQGYAQFGLVQEQVPANETPKQTILESGNEELRTVVSQIAAGKSGVSIVELDAVDTYIAYAPLNTSGYGLGIAVPVSELNIGVIATRVEIQTETNKAMQAATFIVLGLLAGSILLSLGIGQVIATPLNRLKQTVGLITTGDLSARAAVESEDETGTLAEAFNAMADKLRETLSGLEQRVAERTEELNKANDKNTRRASQFEAIARVAHTISSTRDLDSLLPKITQVISAQFGFYHIGIFLKDALDEYAVLVAANSEGGQMMLARQHRLKVGETGIVGFVTKSGHPRVALDTGTDAVFFENPDLPETHSEIALPLRTGNQVIGALDVQSTEINAFFEEDVNILSTLADQVSIAIQNARYYEQANRALIQAEAATQQLSVQAWKEFKATAPLVGYQFDGVNAKPVHETTNGAKTGGLAVPLRLRGQTVGTLRLTSVDPKREWTEDEIALAQAAAERAAIALESARLLRDAQQRAAKEQTISDFSAKIGGLVDLDGILQTTVQELSKNMPDAEVAIQLRRRD